MKKLRKVIALILTLSMVLSMTTVNSFAAESDGLLEGSKTAEKITGTENAYKVTVQVPGGEGEKQHDEVIVMVDGSYSMDSEWDNMKDGIMEIGRTVLDGTGNTQLTLMTFGISHNVVVKHVKSVPELEAALPDKPGGLLYGRSATNCQAGFEGVQSYIENHDSSLKNAYVIYMTDGGVNMNSKKVDWISLADNVSAPKAEQYFMDSLGRIVKGDLKVSEVTKSVYGKDIDRIIELYPYYKEYASRGKNEPTVAKDKQTLAEKKAELAQLKQDIADKKAEREALDIDQNEIDMINAEIAEHEAQIEVLEARAAELDNTEEIAEINSEIEARKARIAELETMIDELEASDEDKTAEIEAANSEIDENKTEITNLEGKIPGLDNSEEIAEINAQIEEHHNMIGQLKTKLGTIASEEEINKLGTLTTDINEMEAQLGPLEAEIAVLEENTQGYDEFMALVRGDENADKTRPQKWVSEAYRAVYKYSNLDTDKEYPIYIAETAYAKYEKELDSDFFNLFYYMIGSAGVQSNNDTAATEAGITAAKSCDQLYLVRYNSDRRAGWMKNVTGSNVTYMESGDISNLTGTIKVLLQDLAKLPYNDVAVTDYMSKWVNLKAETIKIYDKDNNVVAEFDAENSDPENGVYKYKWTGEALCVDKAPIVLEMVSEDGYAAGGSDVEGNTNGDIYKITWNIKDGPLYRADNYRMEYEVTVDVEEENFQYNTEYPANGNTDLNYTDENGEDVTNDIDVPDVNVPREELPEDEFLQEETPGDGDENTQITEQELPDDQYLQEDNSGKDTAAQTGDTSNICYAMMLAAAALAVMGICRRKSESR